MDSDQRDDSKMAGNIRRNYNRCAGSCKTIKEECVAFGLNKGNVRNVTRKEYCAKYSIERSARRRNGRNGRNKRKRNFVMKSNATDRMRVEACIIYGNRDDLAKDHNYITQQQYSIDFRAILSQLLSRTRRTKK